MAKTIIKKTKFLCDAKFELRAKTSSGGDSGSLSGYLAVYNVLDFDGEIFLPGCFAKSIAQKIASGAGRVPYMSKHIRDGGDAGETIGSITAASEDERGLHIDNMDFSSDTDAQKIRTRIVEKHIRGQSVGFRVIEMKSRPPATPEEVAALALIGRQTVNEFIECELVEGTATVNPANEFAQIANAKTASPDACPHCGVKSADPVIATEAPATPPPDVALDGKAARKRKLKLLGL